LAEALEIDPANLHKIIHHLREIPNHKWGDFWRTMLRYGYSNIKPSRYWALLLTTNDKISLLSGRFLPFFKSQQYVLIDYTNLKKTPNPTKIFSMIRQNRSQNPGNCSCLAVFFSKYA
jgi:hypothetical protein